jgi:hypothetical protein
VTVSEHAEHWSLLTEPLVLESLRFDFAVTFVVGINADRLELRVEETLVLTDPAGNRHEADPEGDPALLAPLLRLLRLDVKRLDAFKDGRLELEFVTGDLVTVTSSEQYEAWGVVGEGGRRFVSVPGGELAVW